MTYPPYPPSIIGKGSGVRSVWAIFNSFETHPYEYEVVGEASSGTETLDLAEKLQPDLILLDLSMPVLGGLDALPMLHKLVPSARILILTMHDDPQYLRQALKHGASGYVLKKAADAELLSAMRLPCAQFCAEKCMSTLR